MPTTLPSGPRLSSIRLACPPPPKVASTTVSPPVGARAVRASSSITGRCSVAITLRDPFPQILPRSPRTTRPPLLRSGSIPRYPRSPTDRPPRRSEEHTSELQSRQYLVCRLLLEKKKKQSGD